MAVYKKTILVAFELEYDDEELDVVATGLGSSTARRGTLADVATHIDGKFAGDVGPVGSVSDNYNLHAATVFPPDAVSEQALALLRKGP